MRKRKGNELVKVIFTVYCVAMFWLLFGQRVGLDTSGDYALQLKENANWVPLHTIRWYLSLPEKTDNPYLLRHALINLAGNIVMFIPLGYFLPRIWKDMQKLWKVFLLVFMCIVGVELLQLVTLLGSCDVDDVILNLMGTVIGYILWRILPK